MGSSSGDRRAGPPIVRSRSTSLDEMDPGWRAEMAPQLCAIVQERYEGMTPEAIMGHIVGRGAGTQIILMYGPRGELAGFGSYRLSELVVDDRRHHVFNAGGYARAGYTGVGPTLIRHFIRGSALAKLRRPAAPLHCVLEAINPASYRRFARSIALVYPHRELVTPPWSERLIAAVVRERRLLPVAQDPWIVANPDAANPTEPDRLEVAAGLRDDPDARFYRERNAGYVHGHMLMVHIPLTASNLLASSTPRLRRRLRRFVSRRSGGVRR